MIKTRLPSRAALVLLAGCTPVDDQIQTTDGEDIEVAWVFMQPFCIILCNNNLATTGSRVNAQGDNASGANTQSQSVTSQQNSP